ncbi:MAG: class I SAM-dependent methyltransferase [Pseudobdellovibrio sp.]
MLSNNTINNALYDDFFLEQTFNSPKMIAHSKNEIAWLTNKLKLKKESSIMDVACGAGRHLKAFVELGYMPNGIDSSPDCIRLAIKNCPEISNQIKEENFLTNNPNLLIKYDLVFIAGASFGYDPSIQTNIQLLEKLLLITSLNGHIAIQFLNKSWANSYVKTKITFWNENPEYYILDKREIQDCILKSDKLFIKKTELIQKQYSDKVYMFTAQEIIEHINSLTLKNGQQFELLNTFDSFSSIPYNELTSATPVIILKRVR